jgi:excisionase family DNA binding protein
MNHELLTVKEAAEILRVSETTIWRMFKDGRLKSISLGGLRRVPREELNRMLKYGIDTHSA